MDNIILNSYSKISDLNVSRETCVDFEKFIIQLKKKNEEINLINYSFTTVLVVAEFDFTSINLTK